MSSQVAPLSSTILFQSVFILTRSMEPSVMAASISAKWKGSPPRNVVKNSSSICVFRRLEIVARGLVIDGRLAQVVDNGADGGSVPGFGKSPYWLSRPPFQNNERAPWPIPGIACLQFADNPIAWAPLLQYKRPPMRSEASSTTGCRPMRISSGAHHSDTRRPRPGPACHNGYGNRHRRSCRLAQEFPYSKGKSGISAVTSLHPQGVLRVRAGMEDIAFSLKLIMAARRRISPAT